MRCLLRFSKAIYSECFFGGYSKFSTFVLLFLQIRWNGHFGRSGNPNLVGSKSGQVKPMTVKLILVASYPGARNYYDRERTTLLSVRIM